MSTNIKIEQSDFDNTEILNDDQLEQIGQEVEELIELLDNDEDSNDSKESTALRYPGLISKTIKRNREDTGILFNIYKPF